MTPLQYDKYRVLEGEFKMFRKFCICLVILFLFASVYAEGVILDAKYIYSSYDIITGESVIKEPHHVITSHGFTWYNADDVLYFTKSVFELKIDGFIWYKMEMHTRAYPETTYGRKAWTDEHVSDKFYDLPDDVLNKFLNSPATFGAMLSIFAKLYSDEGLYEDDVEPIEDDSDVDDTNSDHLSGQDAEAQSIVDDIYDDIENSLDDNSESDGEESGADNNSNPDNSENSDNTESGDGFGA